MQVLGIALHRRHIGIAFRFPPILSLCKAVPRGRGMDDSFGFVMITLTVGLDFHFSAIMAASRMLLHPWFRMSFLE